MKKMLQITFALTIAGLMLVAYKVMRVTAPYRIDPISVERAAEGSVLGYTFNETNKILSIFSFDEIVLVSDPGASFLYEEIWLVPIRSGVRGELTEYRYRLPQYARKDHINDMNAIIPEEILQIAIGASWN